MMGKIVKYFIVLDKEEVSSIKKDKHLYEINIGETGLLL
jgi:uncharacterized protein (UPF0333 family)